MTLGQLISLPELQVKTSIMLRTKDFVGLICLDPEMSAGNNKAQDVGNYI